jgi:hypothetical protein
VTGTLTAPAFGGGRGRGGAGGPPPGGAGGGGGGGGGGGFGGGAGGAMPAPTPVDISNGKIAGALLTFDVVQAGRGGGPQTTNHYSGTVTNTVTPWVIGGTITMPPRGGEGDPMVMPWTATKQATP